MSRKQKLAIKFAIVGCAVAVGTWMTLGPSVITPEGLPADMAPEAPQRCVAVFLVCMSLWFTNLIPLAATGLLAIALLPLLDVLPKDEAFSLFGNSAVFFMLGVFLLSAAMISTGLSKRITLLFLQRFDRSPTRLVVGVTVSASFLALWMPEHAVAAMIFPIVVEIIDTLDLKQGANYAKKLFLGLAWGSIIGGVGTFLGGARAPLALSLLHEAYPTVQISFLSWMIAALPIVLIMTALAVWTLCARIPHDIEDIKPATRMLDQRVRRLGPMSGRELRLAALGIATIAAWISMGHTVGLAVIAMVSAVILFLLRVIDWKAAQDYANWGVLVMYGGAVALGAALTETKAMEWLAHQVISPQTPPLFIVLTIATVAIVLTEGISNAAAVAILLPIGYSLGDTAGVGPVMMTLAVTIPAGLAFLLPVGSPPNAISFSAGHYSIRQAVQIGWPLTVTGLAVVFAVIVAWWGIVLKVNAW
ncbi:MAG: DASS family sodium-coupled anion symporter [Phycisphaerales bacterium]|nr:MAG: DASS family sodium-coupled anion symporter [Phycisphaerales bacterium]